MAHLEGAYDQVNRRLAGFDLRFDAVDRKIESLRSDLAEKIDSLDGRVDQRFMWTIGVVLSTWLATILAIFFHR